MKKTILYSTLMSMLQLANVIFAQTPYLVKQINLSASSYPSELTNVNGTLFFVADNGFTGLELWKSDGTTSGTTLVKDVYAGSQGGVSVPNAFINVNGTLFFIATNGINGIELWKSDGTTSGTIMVKDIRPGFGSSTPYNLINFNDTLFFTADDGVHGYELWKSDGTASGTVMVKDIIVGASSGGAEEMTIFNGSLYFSGDGLLYKSDGTDPGTVIVKNTTVGAPGSAPREIKVMNGFLYFRAYSDASFNYGLWKSDGTDAGTVLIKNMNSNQAGPLRLAVFNNTLFFWADDGSGTGRELWKSDGTVGGTIFLKDLNPGSVGSEAQYPVFTVGNGFLFFWAYDGSGNLKPWKTDGTAAGTYKLNDLFQYDYGAVAVNGTVYFPASNTSYANKEIWKTDGSIGGTVILDFTPGNNSSYVRELTQINNKIFFQGGLGGGYQQLWAMDCITEIPEMKNDINSNLTIYPNPLNNQALINFVEAQENVVIKIIDAFGKEIKTINFTGKELIIEKEMMTEGIYFVQIIDGNKNVMNKKIIVQ